MHVCIACMFAMPSASLTWQPAACSCGCAVLQGQHAVGIGTQQLPWLETPSHKHSQSPEPGARPLLGKEEMLLGVPLRPEPRLELLRPWLRSILLLEMPPLVLLPSSSFTSITLSSEMELGPVCIPEPESRVTKLREEGRTPSPTYHVQILDTYPPPNTQPK